MADSREDFEELPHMVERIRHAIEIKRDQDDRIVIQLAPEEIEFYADNDKQLQNLTESLNEMLAKETNKSIRHVSAFSNPKIEGNLLVISCQLSNAEKIKMARFLKFEETVGAVNEQEKALQKLENAVNEMRAYEMVLRNENASDKADALNKGIIAIDKTVTDLAKVIRSPQANLVTKMEKFLESSPEIKGQVQGLTAALSSRRTNWNTIVKNIVAALTGVGALILGFHAGATWLHEGSPRFFFSPRFTKSQEKANQVMAELRNLQTSLAPVASSNKINLNPESVDEISRFKPK